MESIRINELARELEVKSKAVLDYLSEIGVTDKKSHSSALEDEVAEKVRAHFRALNQEAAEEEPATGRKGSAPAKTARVSPPSEAKRDPEVRPEFQPIRRSIAEIKAEARKAVAPAPPRPVTAAERVAEKVSATAPSATGSPAGPARIPSTLLGPATRGPAVRPPVVGKPVDRKSTRLNSSHGYISYAVFCLKKKIPVNSSTTRSADRPASKGLNRLRQRAAAPTARRVPCWRAPARSSCRLAPDSPQTHNASP